MLSLLRSILVYVNLIRSSFMHLTNDKCNQSHHGEGLTEAETLACCTVCGGTAGARLCLRTCSCRVTRDSSSDHIVR